MSLIGKSPSRHLTAAEFAEEISSWRRSGGQDAGNVMDPNEIEDRLGAQPTPAAIKKWLLDQGSPPDVDDYLSVGVTATAEQKRVLHEAWAEGWASYAARYMRDHHPVEKEW